jgi:UDP-N-acetylmuramyl pentapeptide synthase
LEFVNEKELAYFTIGKIFKTLNDHGFNSVSDLVEQVNLGDIKDTLVLLKGSRGIALEQLIGAL